MDQSSYKLLITAAEAFYLDKGVSPLTDKEYDVLLKQMKEEDPKFNIFDKLSGDRKEVKHHVKFPDLQKKQLEQHDYEKMLSDNKWLADMESKGYLAEPKMSGCSIVIYYDEEGNIYDILTKSNDYSGKRKLTALSRMVPHKVKKGIHVVNAEAIIDLSLGYGSTSEAKANGLVNSVHKPEEVRSKVTLVAWDVLLHKGVEGNKLDYYESLYDLKTEYFKICTPVPASLENLVWVNNYLTPPGSPGGTFNSLIDGMVIYDSKHNLKYALKFYYTTSKDVRVKEVKYNLSDKLGYIPQIKFDLIDVDGIKVKQCASNGIMNLINNKIGVDSLVRIARVNSSSPQMVRILEANGFKYPKCPRCSTQLEKADIIKSVIYCSNPLCKDKIDWINRFIGNATIEKFFSNPDKYTIESCNLSNFDKNRKRKKKWSSATVGMMVDYVATNKHDEFRRTILDHFDVASEDKLKIKYLVPAIIHCLSKKLF